MRCLIVRRPKRLLNEYKKNLIMNEMDYLKENVPLHISQHPEWVVSPNYLDLIYSKLNIDKDLYKEHIENVLIELNLDRTRPTEHYTTTYITEEHVQHLRDIPQPEQRSAEWFLFRHEHITASNAWKAFGTNSTKNQLIYEKCKPINPYVKSTPSFNETPMSWGHQYEPLTRMIYEDKNETTIEDFGCLPHATYNFLAASPDGIVTGKNNFGRMIEIKNVVSRVINGIPKLDYYIQCLIQMEVCDLPECDFVETKFVEYDTYNEFINDTNDDLFISKDNKMKGAIMVFATHDSYKYVYMPFSIKTEFELNQWLDETMIDANWIKNVFWKLDVYSCVLIKRKSEWFSHALPQLQEIWTTICAERIGDYSLRAPKKRNTKMDINKMDDTILNECN